MALNLEQASGLNAVFAVASAGAALTGLSGAASTYSTSAFGFAVNGVLGFKALVAAGASPTLDINSGIAFPAIGILQAAAFVWGVNAAGAIVVAKGPTVAWPNTNVASAVLQLPALPAGYVAFAYHLIQNGAAGSAFTFGVSLWSQAGVVAPTVVNVAQLPNAGLTSL